VHDARTFDHLADFIVPGFQHRRQLLPTLRQTARRQLEKKTE
jgi:hypothetical protein